MQRGLISMAIGLLGIAIGIAVTIGSYAAVAGKGGYYFIAWGAVLFGALSFLRGLYQFLRAAVMPEGRSAIGALLWPQSGVGWFVRVAISAVAAGAFWFLAPDSWKTMSPASAQTFEGEGDVRSVAYAPGGQWVAMAMGYEGVKIRDASTGQAVKAPPFEAYADIQALAFSPDGRACSRRRPAAVCGSGRARTGLATSRRSSASRTADAMPSPSHPIANQSRRVRFPAASSFGMFKT
jgi:hypothetical protein